MKYMLVILLLLPVALYAKQKKVTPVSDSGTVIWSGQLVKKPYINKRGVPGKLEWYFRASVQDYYIKMCVSKVTDEQLEVIYKEPINSVTFELELVTDGEWDSGCGDGQVQSRVGSYIIVKRLVK